MVEISLELMGFEFDVVQAIAAGLVWYSSHVEQLEAVIKSVVQKWDGLGLWRDHEWQFFTNM